MSRINHSLKLLHGLLCVCVCVGGIGTRAFFVEEGVPGHGGRGTVCVCVSVFLWEWGGGGGLLWQKVRADCGSDAIRLQGNTVKLETITFQSKQFVLPRVTVRKFLIAFILRFMRIF